MKKFTSCLVLFFICCSSFSQCFDCAKNNGMWTEDGASDIAVTNDGLLYTYNMGGFDPQSLKKYDFNCNLLWSKNFGNNDTYIMNITVDNSGNIYVVLITDNGQPNGGPYNLNGTMYYHGSTLIKLDSNGNTIWYRKLGGSSTNQYSNLFYRNGKIYFVGSFYFTNNVNNEIQMTSTNYYSVPHTFLAVFDLEGHLVDAKKIGETNELYTSSEMDNVGNIYLSNIRLISQTPTTKLECYDLNFNLVWSNVISSTVLNPNFWIYTPTRIHWSSLTNKLYVWGTIISTCDILGNLFIAGPNNSGIINSVLTEFNITNGTLERHKHVKNFGNIDSLNYNMNTAFIEEKDGKLYIFTNFKETLEFPNETISSTSYLSGNFTYHAQEMVLFKVSLNTFESEFILKTNFGNNGLNITNPTDIVEKIIFNGNDLYMTGTFVSNPLTINGTIINNNSGNGDSDAMLYKFNVNSINSGIIKVENTCLNEITSFELAGNYNSISWDFGDPASSSNTSNAGNPEHKFSSGGIYLVKATVTCAGGTQIIEKEILISSKPNISPIAQFIECESVSGSGIASFNTSTIDVSLINGQQNVIVKYYDANGDSLPSPLPNLYINTVVGGDIITARLYFAGNPDCYAETPITFTAVAKPLAPVVVSQSVFCKQENATLNEIIVTGQDIKWYDALTAGTLLSNTTLLVNGTTYYVSQTITGCESEQIAVVVTVNETVAPSGLSVQTFCDTQILTLADFVVSGTDILFYDNSVGGNLVPVSTTLVDGVNYYASQTLSGCESFLRLALTPDIISGVPANGYSELICDNLNDGIETVDLSDYNANLIANDSAYTFKYYTTYSAAENEGTSIIGFTDYDLSSGLNTIYVRVMFANSCYEVVALELTVIPLPKLNMKDTYAVCDNGFVTITADDGFDSYNWSTGQASQSISVSQGGNYEVTVTKNTNGLICSSTKNITVEVSERATITTVETLDWTSSQNIITIYVDGSGVYEYSVDGVNFQSSNQFYGLPNGEYTIYVNDTKGCGVSKKDVYLLMYPKYFTPNEDSYNDFWGIQFYQNEINLVVKIFDRYGKFIKQLNATDPVWDGTYNGNNLPATDYWFTVIREDGTEYKGHFSLKR